MKKKYRVPLVWQMWGCAYIEAESKEEAIEYALGSDCPLPDGDYLDDSILLDDTTPIEISEIETV